MTRTRKPSPTQLAALRRLDAAGGSEPRYDNAQDRQYGGRWHNAVTVGTARALVARGWATDAGAAFTLTDDGQEALR